MMFLVWRAPRHFFGTGSGRASPALGAAVLLASLLLGCGAPPVTPAKARPTPVPVASLPPLASATAAPAVVATTTPPILPTVVPPTSPPSPTADEAALAPRLTAVAMVSSLIPPTPTAVPPTATPMPPTATPKPSLAPGVPVQLVIPKIGVNAKIQPVGVTPAGALATPNGFFSVGWWDQGPRPGQVGNAVIDGHLDSAVYGMAVFWRLRELQPGDQILVRTPDNQTLTFVVQQLSSYLDTNAPLTKIFGPADTANLNLITCDGIFDHATHEYNRRLIVYTRLASAS